MVFLRCGVRFPWRILEKSRLPTVTLEGSRDFLRVFSRSSVSHLFLSTETPVDGDDGGDGVKCVCSACVGCVCLCPESLQGGRCSCHCHDPQGFTQALAPLEQRNSLRFSFCSCARFQECCGPVSNPRHLTQNFAENCPEAVSGRLHS